MFTSQDQQNKSMDQEIENKARLADERKSREKEMARKDRERKDRERIEKKVSDRVSIFESLTDKKARAGEKPVSRAVPTDADIIAKMYNMPLDEAQTIFDEWEATQS